MRKRLHDWWRARAPRERAVLGALAALLAALVYASWVHSAADAGARLGARVAGLRAQAERLDRQAQEIYRLRAAPAAAASGMDLRALVQAQVDADGLAGALTRLDRVDVAHVQVSFGAVGFARWLDWVAKLQAQQVRLDTVRIEALAAPGQVSASATFERPERR